MKTLNHMIWGEILALDIKMKICKTCQQTKLHSEFVTNKACVGGIENRCKVCAAQATKLWKQKNPEKALIAYAKSKLWDSQNKDKLNASKSKNRAKRKQRLVEWDAELTAFVIEEAHHLRGLRDILTGFKWHVDHIIPLVGKIVSGLHIWNNIQVIPATLNLRKNNFYET